MKKTIWLAIDHREIVYMWTKGIAWSLTDWKLHCKAIYPNCNIVYKTIKF